MEIDDQQWAARQLHDFFKRPFMGGMLKSGLIATGTREEIRAEVQSVLEKTPQQFILAAECALLGDVHWPAVRVAVDAAHHILD
jgi:uroporphyrinogen-III decarboxylase